MANTDYLTPDENSQLQDLYAKLNASQPIPSPTPNISPEQPLNNATPAQDATNPLIDSVNNKITDSASEVAPSANIFDSVNNRITQSGQTPGGLTPDNKLLELGKKLQAKNGRAPAKSSSADASADESADSGKKATTLADILNKLKGNDTADLPGAQQAAAQNNLLVGLGRAANQMLGGAMHTNIDNSAYDALAKTANSPVENVMNQQKLSAEQLEHQSKMQALADTMLRDDPNSEASAIGRQIIKESAQRAGFNINVPDTLPLSGLEKMLPGIEGMANRKLAMDMSKMNRDTALGMKQDDKVNDRFTKLNQKMTEALGSSKSAFGRAALNAQAIDNAQALLAGTTDFNDLDNRQVYEASRVLDRVLSQGAPTEAATGHLTPDTARGWLSKKLELVTNQRQGANAGSFVKTIDSTFDREKSQAQKQILKTQSEILGTEGDLIKKNPDKWQAMLRAHNIPIDYNTQKPNTQTSNQKTYSQDVQDYAKANNISLELAQSYKDNYKGQ